MPKRVYKINNFHGGLNNSSDPRDVDDKELTECTDAMVDTVGKIRMSGSYFLHQAEQLDSDINGGIDGGGLVNAPGSGFFYFSHDRKGAEDAGDSELETGDDYLALYDDHDAQIWVYSKSVDDGGSSGWDDDKDSSNNGVINFLGKSTSLAARPCFFSVDGVLKVSTGEFSKYASGSLIDMGSNFLSNDRVLTVDNGGHFKVGNYLRIEDEILYVKSKSTHDLTVIRGVFGTKIVNHDDDKDIDIVNMNQWYGYINNKLFQNSTRAPIYSNNKWYNEIQHLRSLDELGISLDLYDAESTSPASPQINQTNKIVVAYWFTTTAKDVGFWNGSYFIGLTPVYEGGQEGPISTVKNNVNSGSLLTAGHNDSTTAILVDDGVDFAVNDIILINAEKMKVTSIVGKGEQISATNDRTFAGGSNWANGAGSNAFNAYDETTGGVLTVTPDDDGSNRQYATLDGANWEDADGGSSEAMVVGATYRLSYTLTVSSYTKGTLSIGTSNDAYALQDVNTHTATFSSATETLDFVYDTDCDKIIIDAATSSVFTAVFDNFSIKRIQGLTVTRGYLGTTPTAHSDNDPVYVIKDSALNINEEILNVQIYITHPDIDATSIATHPLLDERITGLKLYTKQYTSDEWFLLKEFDLLEGGEHGWATYNSDAGATTSSSGGNTLTGYWKTTSTADSLSVAAPSATDSYDGPSESNTCTSILTLNEPKGLNRVGILRLSGFDNSPLYKEVNLNKTESQSISFDVVNPAPGTHKFIVELLDENFNIMARAEVQQAIGDSGVDASPRGGVGGDIGSGSS